MEAYFSALLLQCYRDELDDRSHENFKAICRTLIYKGMGTVC